MIKKFSPPQKAKTISVNRRLFLKYASYLTFITGAAISLYSFFLRYILAFPPPLDQDQISLDKLKFLYTLFPFDSFNLILKYSDEILSNKNEWDIIDKTFFNDFYRFQQKRFSKLRNKEREEVIKNYIEKNKDSNLSLYNDFNTAKNNLIKFFTSISFLPLSAYGYPEKKSFLFFADPSWNRYHQKP